MKTQFKFPKLTLLLATTAFILNYGCKSNSVTPSVDACAANAELVSKAATTFSNSPTKANCEAYLASVNTYLDSCPGLTTAQRADYKAQIAATKCQ
ncbi:hypothetical protein LV89_02768 [Arcicella aurantiaca]|jgi:hypothetical protein|uniref:Lipoprotein n=1 Tax=Arcicella aurantiaca TaxID=591202 RepID=A0A316E6H8_9BACT|nr:hypothetical protein [Arcicella aurantiaca]PWK25142.1 hypothetical protein LV89_02768 [Arcicella aurantiaca]